MARLRRARAWLGLVALMAAASAAPALAGDAKPLCTAATRACYLQTAKAYFDAVMRADAAAAPFAADLRVTEQGRVVTTSRAAFLAEMKTTGATKGLRNMRFLVDDQAGEVAVFVLGDVRVEGEAPYTVRRVQRMKIVHGLITEVEIVLYVDHSHPEALWPDA